MSTITGRGAGYQHDCSSTADETGQPALSLVVVSGGSGDPSSTRRLADRIADRVSGLADRREHRMTVSVIELRELATEIATAIVSGLHGPKLTRATELLNSADGVVASSPVYKAGASGLFSAFFHVLDNDLLIAEPVILAATAESSRHALVIDDGMRPLFAYLRTLVTPTSIFAAPGDWADPELNSRIDRAALELVLLVESGFAAQIRSQSWDSYQHEYGSAGGTQLSVDLESDLMRLATGGSADG
jgi:FMN reductase